MIASGDLRLVANQICWPAQERVEKAVRAAIENAGYEVIRGHVFDKAKRHGFIDSQKRGLEVFRELPPDAPLVVVEAVWQYSNHVLPGLYTHGGPILTVANWNGEWPGLVGMLNLNGGLTKAGVRYSTLWSVNFDDAFFLQGLERWLEGETLRHDESHVRPLSEVTFQPEAMEAGREVARDLLKRKAIMGVFDEGCMGMYNAIIPDELLHATGVFKERLSQSALWAAMLQVGDGEARDVRNWIEEKGLQFKVGTDPERELTDEHILGQCKMYIAALRIADQFGCDMIGIQYQLGLKDLAPASDLAEGLLNNVDRPPVRDVETGRVLYEGNALPHFNEVDECAGLDGLLTNRIWRRFGYDPETTLHDIRFGEDYNGQFVWVFEISGAAPPQHFVGGYRGAVSERQPPLYFRLGGGSLKGVSKPGEIVWSRVFVDNGVLKADLGRATVVELPEEETQRRWKTTTSQWPIMHAVLHGVTRDQMMGRHKANHIQVAYGPDAAGADRALAAKAAAFEQLGLTVHICGTTAQ